MATIEAALTTGKSESAFAFAMHFTPWKIEDSLAGGWGAGRARRRAVAFPPEHSDRSEAGALRRGRERAPEAGGGARAPLCVSLGVPDRVYVKLSHVHPSLDGGVHHPDGRVVRYEVEVVFGHPEHLRREGLRRDAVDDPPDVRVGLEAGGGAAFVGRRNGTTSDGPGPQTAAASSGRSRAGDGERPSYPVQGPAP